MLDEDEFVETSDVEELAEELGRGEARPWHPSPRRSVSPLVSEEIYPRKKMKLFHETRDSDYKTESTLGSLDGRSEFHTPPSRTQSSSTVPTIGSPSQSLLESSRSPTWTPASPQNSPTKWDDDVAPIDYTHPSQIQPSQDPLLLHSPTQHSHSPVSSPQSPFTEGQVYEYWQDSDVMDNTTPMDLLPEPSSTPQSQPSDVGLSQSSPRSQSPDPLALLKRPPLQPKNIKANTDLPSSPLEDATLHDIQDTEELFNFSPIKPRSPSCISVSSPLTPVSRRSSSPIREDGDLFSSPPSHKLLSPSHRSSPPLASRKASTTPLVAEIEVDDAATAAALAAQQDGKRYSLRRRNAAQMAPYTVDSLRYNNQLKHNPEAIVKIKNYERLGRTRHPDDHYEDEGDTQRDGYVFEGGDDLDAEAEWEEQEGRRKRGAEKQRDTGPIGRTTLSPERRIPHYTGFLQDLSSTDDEDREMDATSKAARKILRAKEKENRAREKEEQRQRRKEEDERRLRGREERDRARRPKPYPLAKPRSSRAESSTSSNRPPSREVPTELERPRTKSPSRRLTSDFTIPSPPHHPVLNPPPPAIYNNDPVLIEYFNEGGDFPMFEPDELPQEESNLPGPSSSRYPLRSPSRGIDNFFTNAQKEPLVVSSDDEGDDGKRKLLRRRSERSQSSDHIIIDLSPAKKRVLNRMMPAFMINKMAAQEAAGKETRQERRATSPSSGVDDIGPILPGKARTRKGNSKGIKEIKGDSESETDVRRDSDSSGSGPRSATSSTDDSDSDSDSVEILHAYQPPSHRRDIPEMIDVDEYDSEGDEDIQFFVQGNLPSTRGSGKTRLTDPSAIDYMLPRVYTTSGGGRRRYKLGGVSRRKHTSAYKFDIMTNGARRHGRERQTLLNFDGHKKRRRRDSEGYTIVPADGLGRSGSTLARTSSSNANGTMFGQVNSEGGGHAELDPRFMSRKDREKRRRAKAKKNGVYSFTSGSAATTGRRVNTGFFTVDLEDEGFHSALAPVSGIEHRHPGFELPPIKRSKPKNRVKPNNLLVGELDTAHASEVEEQDGLTPRRKTGQVAVDLNIKPLHSGMSFGPTTYIRRGYLHDLINTVARSQKPTLPSCTPLLGFELKPTMGVSNFCSSLSRICEAFFDFATGLPDPDADALYDQWKVLTRCACQLLSWYLEGSLEEEQVLLRKSAEAEVLKTVDQIEKVSLSFVATPILTLCWFLVELSSRLAPQLTTSFLDLPRPLKASSKALVRRLLQFGIYRTSELLQTGAPVDGPEPVHYTTELWVRLVHLLNQNSSKSHPFWHVVLDGLQSAEHGLSKKTDFSASEDVWLTIFTICALSQFSAHGMSTAEPRLPAYWDLVAFALKKICLKENSLHHRSESQIFQQRDLYVASLTTRCFVLHGTWKWGLKDASPMINQLAEIFRSRNFASLRHEGSFPKFFRQRNWDFLSVHNSTDTAFGTFLGLIVLAVREEENDPARKASAKIKKFLSLAVPLGALPFTASNPPQGRDSTMFYNRLSAVAVAIYLDASDYEDRVKRASSYIPFDTAGIRTRHEIICGFERLAVLMLKRGIDMSPMMTWAGDMARITDEHVRSLVAKDKDGREIQNESAVQLASHLLMATSQIATTYTELSLPPDLDLLIQLFPLLRSPLAKHTDWLNVEIVRFLDAIFTSRAAVLPKPVRPVRQRLSNPIEDESESQDYFGNYDDLDMAFLDSPALQLPELPKNEEKFAQVLKVVKWTVYEHLKPLIKSPPPPEVSFNSYANTCDKWLRLFLCCSHVQRDEKKWAQCLTLLDALRNKPGEENILDQDAAGTWQSRVNLSIVFQLLQLDPLTYEIEMDRAIEALFLALVSNTTSLENQYVSFLLSIDCLAHPLLVGVTDLPPRNAVSGDYEFTGDEFVAVRLLLIKAIFKNIDYTLETRCLETAEGGQKYTDLCFKMLSQMRSIRTDLMRKADGKADKLQTYTSFCLQVLEALRECPQLRAQERLSFFGNWARTFAIPQ